MDSIQCKKCGELTLDKDTLIYEECVISVTTNKEDDCIYGDCAIRFMNNEWDIDDFDDDFFVYGKNLFLVED